MQLGCYVLMKFEAVERYLDLASVSDSKRLAGSQVGSDSGFGIEKSTVG